MLEGVIIGYVAVFIMVFMPMYISYWLEEMREPDDLEEIVPYLVTVLMAMAYLFYLYF